TVERQSGGKRKGHWMFSQATVRSIDGLYDALETAPLVPELVAIGRKPADPKLMGLWLRHHLPQWLRWRLGPADSYSFALYQVLGILLLVLLIVPVDRLVEQLVRRVLRYFAGMRHIAVEEREYRAWSRPIGWFAVSW